MGFLTLDTTKSYKNVKHMYNHVWNLIALRYPKIDLNTALHQQIL